MKERWFGVLFSVVLVAALGGVGYLWWQRQQPPAAPQEARTMTRETAEAPAPAPPVAEGPRYPVPEIETAEAAPTAPVSAEAAVAELVDRPTALALLQTDGLVRRMVATIDNLGRPHAPPRLWPVHPPKGRYTVSETPAGTLADRSNAARYEPYIALAEGIDARRAIGWYVRLYPEFQQAYEELGYPGRHFNDRLVHVIDLLLATPHPAEPPRLRLVQVQGPVPSTRPWVRYEFEDPALESLASGQKILLRLNPAQAERVKAVLTEWRGLLAGSGTAR